MIDTIRRLRRATASAFADAVEATYRNNPTEVEIRDAFHECLQSVPDTRSDGWYMPPPHGLIVGIGEPPGFERLKQASYRPESSWPSDRYRLTDNAILYWYGSPVDLDSGLIGDISCSLYRGSDNALREHMRNAWHTTIQIAKEAEAGMALAEVHERAGAIMEKSGFANIVVGVNDPTGTNIGHTIPWSNEEISADELSVLQHGSSRDVAALVSGKRRFVNAIEPMTIRDNLAFTIEPRLSAPNLPTVSFHIVVAFENGERAIISEYEPVFRVFGMDGFDV